MQNLFRQTFKKPFLGIKSALKSFSEKKVRKIDPFSGKSLTFPPPNPKRFLNKSAIITGGSQGVGKETSVLFAQSGIESLTIADVIEKKGKELAEQINEEQKRHVAKFVHTDVSKDKEDERLFIEHLQSFGKLNILFNNAGVMLEDDIGPTDTDLSAWHKTMEINVTSVFLCCKYGIPEMLKSKGGSIINVSSIVALVGSANPQLAYTASKAAVSGMTRELAAQYAQSGIRVNAVFCKTDLKYFTFSACRFY